VRNVPEAVIASSKNDLSARSERVDERGEGRFAQASKEIDRAFDRTEPHQGREARQRANQLRLVTRVLVVSVRRIERNAELLFASKAVLGAFEARMGLQRQRLRGGEQLQKEWQPCAVSGDDARAQQGLGRFGDELRQRLGRRSELCA
jgi:hypothetical protein